MLRLAFARTMSPAKLLKDDRGVGRSLGIIPPKPSHVLMDSGQALHGLWDAVELSCKVLAPLHSVEGNKNMTK